MKIINRQLTARLLSVSLVFGLVGAPLSGAQWAGGIEAWAGTQTAGAQGVSGLATGSETFDNSVTTGNNWNIDGSTEPVGATVLPSGSSLASGSEAAALRGGRDFALEAGAFKGLNDRLTEGRTGVGSFGTQTPRYIEGDVIVGVYAPQESTDDELSGELLAYLKERMNGEVSERQQVAADGNEQLTALLEQADNVFENRPAEETVMDSGSTESLLSGFPIHILYIHSDEFSTRQMIRLLKQRSEVVYAEPNYMMSAQTADIPDFTQLQYAYDASGQSQGHDSRYGLEVPGWPADTARYEAELGSSDAPVVAVLDSGVDYTHPDLAEQMWHLSEEAENVQAALQAEGFSEYGYNALAGLPAYEYKDTTNPYDDHLHGTHCAGIIAAAWNDFGISGAAPNARIMAVKALDMHGSGSNVAVIRGLTAILKAREAGVNIRVVSMSLGGMVLNTSGLLVMKALNRAGVALSIASGNDSSNIDYLSDSGSYYSTLAGAVLVDAADKEGRPADFTNYGVRRSDIAAPGVDILSTVPKPFGMPDPQAATASEFYAGFDDNSGQLDEYETWQQYGGTESGEPGENESSFSIRGYTEGKWRNSMSLEHEADNAYIKVKAETGDKNLLTRASFSEIPESAFIRLDDGEEYAILRFRAFKESDNVEDETVSVSIIFPDNELSTYSLTLTAGEPGKSGYASVVISRARYEAEMELGEGFPFLIWARADREGSFAMGMDDFCFIRGTEAEPDPRLGYAYESGTSMACPAVSGELAMLAARYPGDSAEKLAARVVGSAKHRDGAFKSLNLSGGYASLENALAERYVPVINSVTEAGGEATFYGYFLQEVSGLSVGGQSARIIARRGAGQTGLGGDVESLTVQLPEGLSGGEQEVRAYNTQGYGRNFFTLGAGAGILYDSQPLPEGEALTALGEETGMGLVALRGKLYYITDPAADEPDASGLRIYSYDLSSKQWKQEFRSQELRMVVKNGAVAYDGKLLIAGYVPREEAGETLYYPASYVYDAVKKSGSLQYLPEEIEPMGFFQFLNTGKGLYLFENEGAVEEDQSIGSYRYTLYQADLKQGKYTRLGSFEVPEDETPANYNQSYFAQFLSLPFYDAEGNGYIALTNMAAPSAYIHKGIHSRVIKLNESGIDWNFMQDFYSDDIKATVETVFSGSESSFHDIQLIGGPIQGGAMIFGPYTVAQERISSDSYRLMLGSGAKLQPESRLLAGGKLSQGIATVYRDRFYYIGFDYEKGRLIFRSGKAESVAAVGQRYSDSSMPESKPGTAVERPASGGVSARGPEGTAAVRTQGSWQQTADGHWRFLSADSQKPLSGWHYLATKTGYYWFHFDANGIMSTGWYLGGDKKWYYLKPEYGNLVTGWQLDPQDGKWYYLRPQSGEMLTGWQLIDGKRYFLTDSSGLSGWQFETEAGAWVYRGGSAAPLGSWQPQRKLQNS